MYFTYPNGSADRAGTAAWQLSLLLYKAHAVPSSKDIGMNQFQDWLKAHSCRVPLFAVALDAEQSLAFKGDFWQTALHSLSELRAFNLLTC